MKNIDSGLRKGIIGFPFLHRSLMGRGQGLPCRQDKQDLIMVGKAFGMGVSYGLLGAAFVD